MKTRLGTLFLLTIFLTCGLGLGAEESALVDKTGVSNTSTYGYKQKSPPPKSTQKTYSIKNDGRGEDSLVLQYDSKPGFATYEDNDSDGRFGESETRLQDLDRDGRRGESEDQLGNENVTQNQKVTVLNNMGSGILSTFKAAGQTQRSSIYVEKKPTKETEETQSAPAVDSEAAAAAAKEKKETAKARVLVS